MMHFPPADPGLLAETADLAGATRREIYEAAAGNAGCALAWSEAERRLSEPGGRLPLPVRRELVAMHRHLLAGGMAFPPECALAGLLAARVLAWLA